MSSATAHGTMDPREHHAALAMDAAKRLKRARRRSQKEKMGRVVCHHLLCLLNEGDQEPDRNRASARETLRTQTVTPVTPLDASACEVRQISLSL